MKKIFALCCIIFASSLYSSTELEISSASKKIEFKEIWAYLMRGEEQNLKGSEPVTDIGYFSLWINAKGRVSEPPKRPPIVLNGKKPRIHLVITELTSYGFTHFILEKKLPIRDQIVDDIVKYSKDFDGIQIDFEMVPSDDRDNYTDFLAAIRNKLPSEKTLSVALPAKRIENKDGYDYPAIAKIVDRIVVMAYDQHWSTSKPGPVAGLKWCASVLDYVSKIVPEEKLIMGLPLYGRAWGRKKASRSLRYHETMDIIKRKKPKLKFSPENGPYFEYYAGTKVTVYFDNTASLLEKINHYKNNNVKAISFWRVGQGPSELWAKIDNIKAVEPSAQIEKIAADLKTEIPKSDLSKKEAPDETQIKN